MRIEQRLKKLADENPNYSLLWAQWEFDKKLLSRALNTVSRDFPHYSLHDASHSSTIITQIEKVIAPNIELLSATDCWLLLESCYWHDAGMIVSYEDKQKLLSQQHFRSYLKELESSDHELSTHAKMIMSEVRGNDPSHALLISNSLTFIISDYFRKEHAERSGHYVTEPSQIKIDSPRTILIPKRLFRFIAQIVQCHGRDREEILSLPKINDGMDITDYAHPRYIAALLRIGDLLDIDDGRFCPTLLANIGEVPQSSIDHQHKHASINDILINSDVIEINAECDHYGGYYAQQNWFDYIQSEFDFQKRIWDRIVPDNSYKSLPTIKALNCEIKGYITLDRKVPKITLDEKRVYSYLTGSHLYSEQLPFLREVVQNAIDATYYKVWEDLLFNPNFLTLSEHKQKITFEESLAKKSINITLKEVINNDLMVGVTNYKNSIVYELFIKDCGDGMAENDIKKMLKVGSGTTIERKAILNNMPEWAKPSGFFGLGMQSVIDACNRIIIKTKKIDNSGFILEISKNDNGNCQFLLSKFTDSRFIGTEIKCYFTMPQIPATISWNSSQLLDSYDPLRHTRLEVMPVYCNEVLEHNFKGCAVPIYLNDNIINGNNDNNTHVNDYFTDFRNGVQYNLFVRDDLSTYINFMYRGVPFENKVFTGGVSGFIDIFKGDAEYWLTLDRKKGRGDRKKELRVLVEDIVKDNSKYIYNESKSKSAASLFFYAKYGLIFDNQWKNYQICGKSIGEYLEGDSEILLASEETVGFYNEFKEKYIYSCNLAIRYLASVAKREGISCELLYRFDDELKGNSHNSKVKIYSLTLKNDGLSNRNINFNVIKSELRHSQVNKKRRCIIPCYDNQFLPISLPYDKSPDWVFSVSDFNIWVDSFIFLRFQDNDTDEDLDLIFNYYSQHQSGNISRQDFKDLYMKCWRELGIV